MTTKERSEYSPSLFFHEYFVGKEEEEEEGEFPAQETPDNTKPYAVNAERRTNRRQGM